MSPDAVGMVPSGCWHCGASPAIYSSADLCLVCGRPRVAPVMGNRADRLWASPMPTITTPKREEMLKRIDAAIARYEAAERWKAEG